MINSLHPDSHSANIFCNIQLGQHVNMLLGIFLCIILIEAYKTKIAQQEYDTKICSLEIFLYGL